MVFLIEFFVFLILLILIFMFICCDRIFNINYLIGVVVTLLNSNIFDIIDLA